MYGSAVRHCLVCGATHATCGPVSTAGTVDGNVIVVREESGPVSELSEYEITDYNGVSTTLQLSEADAKRIGAKRVKTAARTAADAEVPNRARTAPDKARRPGTG